MAQLSLIPPNPLQKGKISLSLDRFALKRGALSSLFFSLFEGVDRLSYVGMVPAA